MMHTSEGMLYQTIINHVNMVNPSGGEYYYYDI